MPQLCMEVALLCPTCAEMVQALFQTKANCCLILCQPYSCETCDAKAAVMLKGGYTKRDSRAWCPGYNEEDLAPSQITQWLSSIISKAIPMIHAL